LPFSITVLLVYCKTLAINNLLYPQCSIWKIVLSDNITTKQVSVSRQEKLRDVEENNLVQEERYFRLLGLDGRVEPWHNTTQPVLVTHARGDAHALAVSFVRAAARLPYTVLLYNLGLKPYSLAVVNTSVLFFINVINVYYYVTG
jgi:hypothetical protein